MEIWKEIPGFEGLYEASTYGRIKSLSRIMYTPRGGMFKSKERILKQHLNKKNGYYYLTLAKNSKETCHRVNRLIALAFIPNPNNYPFVLHSDDNPSNNHVDNLRWGTPKHNSEDMVSRNRQKDQRGIKNTSSKLTEQQVKEIRSKYIPRKYSQQKLANEYGVTQQTIWEIISRKIWSHI